MKITPFTKWIILALTAVSASFVVAAPSVSLSVLFKEISTDLNLDLVQIGFVWSIGSLPAIFTSLLSGVITDQLSPKRVIIAGILLVGIAGACRGLATNFPALLFSILAMGVVTPIMIMTSYKINGLWFPPRQLGLANGIFSMGMATGFMLGSFFSANFLSPWLGGWRNVMVFYGAVAGILCIPWLFSPNPPSPASTSSPSISFANAIGKIVKLKNIWLLGLVLLGYSGALQGILGYLPLHLRDLGWSGMNSDGALTLFHAMSMLFVVPITFLSDRLRLRKNILLFTLALTFLGTTILIFANAGWVWLAVILIGIGRDATMALSLTMGIEMEGVGPTYAGTATGFVFLFSSIGNLLSSPVGNSLAQVSPGMPFAFWAGLAVLAFCSLLLVKTSKKQTGVSA